MILALVPYCMMWVLIYIKREILGNPVWLPDWYEGTYGFFFAAFSVSVLFLILAYFFRFEQSGTSLLDPMRADAYGISWCTTRSCCGCNTGCSITTCRQSPRLRSRSC